MLEFVRKFQGKYESFEYFLEKLEKKLLSQGEFEWYLRKSSEKWKLEVWILNQVRETKKLWEWRKFKRMCKNLKEINEKHRYDTVFVRCKFRIVQSKR